MTEDVEFKTKITGMTEDVELKTKMCFLIFYV